MMASGILSSLDLADVHVRVSLTFGSGGLRFRRDRPAQRSDQRVGTWYRSMPGYVWDLCKTIFCNQARDCGQSILYSVTWSRLPLEGRHYDCLQHVSLQVMSSVCGELADTGDSQRWTTHGRSLHLILKSTLRCTSSRTRRMLIKRRWPRLRCCHVI